MTSASSVVLRLAQDKFAELCSNDEYLFDCDKNTKEEAVEINKLLSAVNPRKLESFLYDELYEGSDFVFFAMDYVNELEELEALLDSDNETLILKTLSILKEKGFMSKEHKNIALEKIQTSDLRKVVEVL